VRGDRRFGATQKRATPFWKSLFHFPEAHVAHCFLGRLDENSGIHDSGLAGGQTRGTSVNSRDTQGYSYRPELARKISSCKRGGQIAAEDWTRHFRC